MTAASYHAALYDAVQCIKHSGLARTIGACRHVYTYLPFLVVQIFQMLLKQRVMLRHQQLVLSEAVEKQASTGGCRGLW